MLQLHFFSKLFYLEVLSHPRRNDLCSSKPREINLCTRAYNARMLYFIYFYTIKFLCDRIKIAIILVSSY